MHSLGPSAPVPSTLQFRSIGSESVGHEQRLHPRAHVRLAVTLASGSNFYVGQTENVSEGGIFVATLFAKPVGSPIDLTLRLEDGGEPLHLTGEVRWVRAAAAGSPGGMGIQFHDLSAADRERILGFTQQREPLRVEP